MPRTLDEYMSLPYTVSMKEDAWDDGTPGWFVWVDELPGCMSQGRSPGEAYERVRDAMLGWLSVALEDGSEIPEPQPEHSGQFMLRLPKSLHGELARRARLEGVSLNQFVTAALAGAVGWRARSTTPDAA